VLENLENAKNKEKAPPTAPSGYVKMAMSHGLLGPPKGRNIASNLSKYAPTDLF